MKKIVVTGAAGFVGKSIVLYLRGRGYEVIPTVRKQDKFFSDAIVWDITKKYGSGAIAGIDAVVHCAAYVDDWEVSQKIYNTNVNGTQNVLEAFPNVKCFIYISSASVYSSTNKEQIINEDSPVGEGLFNLYSLTKLQGEQIVKNNKHVSERVILRPHIIYGPGDTTIAPRLKRSIRFGRMIAVGDGQNKLSLTHINNLSQAVELVLKNKKKQVGYNVYNITDEMTGTAADVLEVFMVKNNIQGSLFFIPRRVAVVISWMLERVYRWARMKTPPLITRYVVDQVAGDHILNIQKAKKELGYTPKENFRNNM